jgi:sulfofructose kinase
MQELTAEGVLTDLVVRGNLPTPLSVILVKPDGRRSVVNYKGNLEPIRHIEVDLSVNCPKVILFDGHEPNISAPLVQFARTHHIVTVLDAGSVHRGTAELVSQVDHVVASERFGRDFTEERNLQKAIIKLNDVAPSVIITQGEKGLIWKRGEQRGRLDSFPVQAVDTTGAGDAFHGAFAAGLAAGKSWPELLQYSNAVGALCCTRYGARPAIPTAQDVRRFIRENKRGDDRKSAM